MPFAAEIALGILGAGLLASRRGPRRFPMLEV
jgi:hypothetical protein